MPSASGNPAAQVGGPELAHLVSGDADWYDWLQRVRSYQAGGQARLRHPSHLRQQRQPQRHLEARRRAPLRQPPLALAVRHAPSVNEVLKSTGWTQDKPVWLTETGWESSRVGEPRQADYYAGFLSDWFTGRPGRDWISKVFFYELKDGPDGSYSWGILRADGSPKPAYGAYQGFIAGH